MLIIECTSCQARYQYDVARFEGKPSKKIRCAQCQQIFEIRNPSLESAPSPTAPEDVLESTVQRKRRRTIEQPLPAIEDEVPQPTGPQDEGARLPAGKRLSLAIIEGNDPGKVFRLETPRVVIGRAGCDLVLNDSESSRNHAQIEVHDHLVILEDLGSTNGTFVSGSRITGPVELQNHSEFTVGTTTLMLIVTDSD